jgi:GNAT superfamily N-acetyltransferase
MESRTLRLQESQLAESSQVLARAFLDDPMMVYLMPEERQRLDVLPEFMQAGARVCLTHGEVYTTPGAVLGNACWLPPGETEITDERIVESGFADVIGHMGEESAARLGTLMGQLGELHHAAVPPEHWYLLLLGVDPERQGQGIGGTLIEPILRRADAERVPCYLETMKPRNVTFYSKHGFDVVDEDDTADGGLHFWTMRRTPR